MEDPRNRHEDELSDQSTASRVEDWLRGLRTQRAASADASARTPRQGAAAPPDDPAEAFLKAARRLAASPRAQQTLAQRLAAVDAGADDPSLRALARVLESLGKELSGALAALGGPPAGGAAVLEPPEVIQQRRLSDDEGGGGDDDFDDDEDDDGGDDDDEPWPSAFIGYRVGVLNSVDVGTCRDGCCTAVFMDHPGLRAAVWFPTETAAALASSIAEFLERPRGDTAPLGVPPFGAGDPPVRGQVQAAMQFFTDDVHLDPVDQEADRRQGGFARFLAYDQSLGHGGPPLVDALIDEAQARALRKGLRRAARNVSRERE